MSDKEETQANVTTASENKTNGETYKFEAEIQRLLQLLIHSLYTHKDVFLREAISNASDALAKVRFELLTNKEIYDKDAELAIWIDIDEDNKKITIKDSGIGMTKQELIENLGTIAQSGTLQFLMKQGEKAIENMDFIGQFGVGFYSLFMVAKKVVVRSKSYLPEEPAYEWESEGTTDFKIRPTEKTDRGTEVIIYLQEEEERFLSKYELKAIIKKYSDFVEFPIYIDEEVVNSREAVWRKQAKDVSEEDHKNFYQHLAQNFDEPLTKIHFRVDNPIQFTALIYVPRSKTRLFFFPQAEWGLRLYSRKVLIQEHSKDVIPEYLRFLVGVVDSDTLPLNVSRETVQVDRELAKIREIVTKRVIKELQRLAKKKPEDYATFWKEHGLFIKEGVASDIPNREALQTLLRFQTNKTEEEELISLDQYIERMKADQKEIYYLIAESRELALKSPHLEYYESNGYEVLLLTEPVDSFLMMNMYKYKDYEFKIIDQATDDDSKIHEHDKKDEEEKEGEEGKESKDEEKHPEYKALLSLMNDLLKDKVVKVRITEYLTTSPARLITPKDSLRKDMEKVYKFFDERFVPQKKILEINPNHPIIQSLNELAKNEPENELVKLSIEQLFEDAFMLDGGEPNIVDMIPRIEKFMATLLEKTRNQE